MPASVESSYCGACVTEWSVNECVYVETVGYTQNGTVNISTVFLRVEAISLRKGSDVILDIRSVLALELHTRYQWLIHWIHRLASCSLGDCMIS